MSLMKWMRGNESSTSAGMIGAGLGELHAAFNGTKNTLVTERESRALRRDDEAVEGDRDPGEEHSTGRRAPWAGAPSVTIRRGVTLRQSAADDDRGGATVDTGPV